MALAGIRREQINKGGGSGRSARMASGAMPLHGFGMLQSELIVSSHYLYCYLVSTQGTMPLPTWTRTSNHSISYASQKELSRD